MAKLSSDGKSVTVESGDTLWAIAKKHLGAGSKYQELAKWNNISNPNMISVGQVIKLSKSSSSSSSSSKSTSNSNTVKIQQFGLLSNSDNKKLFATWTWTKEKTTDYYQIKWYYHTGDNKWFVGNEGQTEYQYSMYDIPSNALRVRFRVKPVANSKEKDGKKTYEWKADWTDGTKETFNVKSIPPSAPSESINVEIKNYRLTATIDGMDLDPINTPTHIKFRIVQDKTKQYAIGTAKINKTYNRVSYNCAVDAGHVYQVQCKAVRGDLESEWTKLTQEYGTPPAAPSGGIKVCRAISTTSVHLEWAKVNNADTYEIEYATNKDHFDVSDQTTKKSDITGTVYEPSGLETGSEYFFRVRANNAHGSSSWSAIKSASVGKRPAAPTTWSSTTTAISGEELTLYWVHNSEDGSSQTEAKLELTINGVKTIETIRNSTNEEDKDKTSSYIINTTTYKEGTTIKWRVKTKGLTLKGTEKDDYSDFSTPRTIDVYAPPTLNLNVTNEKGEVLDTVSSYPFHIEGNPGPNTQKPIGYHVSIVSNETYESVDEIGNFKMVNEGDEVYSKYFDISDPLVLKMSAGHVDLENGVTYTVNAIVSMDSGLTAESSTEFTVSWTEDRYTPNAEIGIDEETMVAHIRPYCEERKMTYYKVIRSSNTFTVDRSINTETTPIDDVYTITGERVYIGKTATGSYVYYCISYVDANGYDIDPVYYSVTNNSGTYSKTNVVVNPNTIQSVNVNTNDEVLLGISNGESIYYCVTEESTLIEGVTLSVYRREFDGKFTELATGINNADNTFITDPHPALDYARYRVVARVEDTGAVSYYDLPGHLVGGKAVIIQWAEEWSEFNVTDEGKLAEPAWTGSMLKLPYNIDVSDNYAPDVSLVEYIGREHPVGYYGTQLGQSSTWNVDIAKNDIDTLYALRRLSVWMGDVYVREPSGSGYWANITVSFSQTHCELTIPVTLSITRVEGGA